MESFVHLHVASGYSMQYGASTPAALVARAAAYGQPALALTDRDGLYGAVRFVQACTEAGIAPILGVDLAVDLTGPHTGLQPGPQSGQTSSRTPAKGGTLRDDRLPRVTILARGMNAGLAPGHGWAQLCRLVTDTHLSGQRGKPRTTTALIADAMRTHDGQPAPLVVLLGPDSDVGRAILARRKAAAYAALTRWQAALPPGSVFLEAVCHGGPEGTPGSLGQAGRTLALGRDTGIPVVLTAAVRHADPAEAATVDVLDAARRLVSLDVRHLDRVTTAGHLAPTPAMVAIARDVAQASGPGLAGGTTATRDVAAALIATTMALATECIQDAAIDLGIGGIHLPEQTQLGMDLDDDPQQVLAARCHGALISRYPHADAAEQTRVQDRLRDELDVIASLGYATYFLTVATVTDLIRDMGVRVAARGSGAGSLVNYLLGISGVDPMRYDLLMERFCSPLRAQLPDIDIDVESARRTEIYEKVLARFGGERVTCVSMMDSYRVRHAIRDVGAALGLPPAEVDAIAKAFPHISARHARSAIADLPELRVTGLASARYDLLFDLVERLDGLPRHIALHPCGVILSNSTLLDRTPVEASWLGFPMTQFDKDDVEILGLLKLDILGIRMQSAMAYAVTEVARVDDVRVDLDDPAHVSLDDEATFRMIRTTRTLGCFQIESPGQRELIGKFGPERFEDLIIDISLFRPGPVKSDMIVPFLNARHGFATTDYLHPTLIPALRETEGVVVFHEQVLKIVAETAGVTLAQADEVRRAMGSVDGQAQVLAWWRPAALARGYSADDVERIWEVLRAFASFGFCKAHAAAFALPTYQSAWLKTHHPAAFIAGVLTHDPGMYPKRLILDDARSLGIEILGLDVNASTSTYAVERVPSDAPPPAPDLPDGRGYGIRVSLADVKGITESEIVQIVAGQPYAGLADFAQRAAVSRPVLERLVLAGGFDSIYGLDHSGMPGARGKITRRDLLLHVADLDRWNRANASRASGATSKWSRRLVATDSLAGANGRRGDPRGDSPGGRRGGPRGDSRGDLGSDLRGGRIDEDRVRPGIAALAAAQSQAAAPVADAVRHTQLILPLDDAPQLTPGSGLPELTATERIRAELEILGLDASAHVVEVYGPMLDALGVTRARDIGQARNRSEVWIAGVKVATQTPPIRSGRRVVFLTLDDSTGPVDATFFEDVQGPYAATVFHSWMMLVRGVVRRTGRRGVSVRATGAWELSGLWEAWSRGGVDALRAALAAADAEAHARAAAAAAAFSLPYARAGGGESVPWSSGEEARRDAGAGADDPADVAAGLPRGDRAGGMGGSPRGRRVLVHASGFQQSPYADVQAPGVPARDGRRAAAIAVPAASREAAAPPRKLWHSSPGSSGA
ncbi:MAG: DNA polymerase III subunit alpha [Dermatophilaceae bacterium]